MIIGKHTKQSREVSDYDIDFSKWLRTGETLVSGAVTIECLTTPANTALIDSGVDVSGSALRIRLSGGTTEEAYKVTVLTTTNSGRVDESEFIVLIRES